MMRQVFVAHVTNLQNFNQMQKEAAIKLLLLVMYADGVIDPEEVEYIERLLLDSTWESNEDLDAFIDNAKEKSIEALEDESKLERYVEHLKLEIADREHLQSVYSICAKMAMTNKHVDDRELDILTMLMASLGD